MTNIIITTAAITLTIAVPTGAMVSIMENGTVEGKPVDQINVVIQINPQAQSSISPTPTPTPAPTATATPLTRISPAASPVPTVAASSFNNIPQPTINDFSQVPQPQSMITDSKVPDVQPNTGTPTPTPSSLPIRNPQGSTFSLVQIN